jgi:hypothetical protein
VKHKEAIPFSHPLQILAAAGVAILVVIIQMAVMVVLAVVLVVKIVRVVAQEFQGKEITAAQV